MANSNFSIYPFDYRRAEGVYVSMHAAFNYYQNRIRAEQLPDDPPRSLRRAIEEWQNLPDMLDYRVWLATGPGGDIAGSSRLRLHYGDDNQHLAWFDVNVVPEWRRGGLAKRLLRPVAEAARAEKRSLLLALTTDRALAGEALMRRMGARVGNTVQVKQLDLQGVDRQTLLEWQQIGADGFTLEFLEPPYSDQGLAAMAALQSMVQNEQPRGEMAVQDSQVTPEQMAKIARFLTTGGRRLWALHVREKGSEQAAGGTVVLLDPEQETIVKQMYTGVYRPFRRRGLARRLKAEMLQKVLGDWPAARFVRTDNAAGNAGMLKINEALGFQQYYTERLWQVETEAVLAYVAG